jgi:MoxR-like ATPase
MEEIKRLYERVNARVGQEIVGGERVIRLSVIALLVGGHILVDDVPGTGKTTFAKAFAASLSLDMRRLQCTPDLLPSDMTGVNYFDMKSSEFRFIPGPAFTNLLLADEINRAMPKTQAGLLECMEEHQITVEGVTHRLREPFMVIATQNPVETRGTYELPEAQLDRFLFRCSMGYPSAEDHVEILRRKFNVTERRTDAEPLPPVTAQQLAQAQAEVRQIFIHPDLMAYATAIGEATRHDGEIELGASPRAIVHLLLAAQGFAATAGRDYVLPDDVKEAAVPTLAHRLVMKNDFYRTRGHDEEIIQRLLEQVSVPTEAIDFSRLSR